MPTYSIPNLSNFNPRSREGSDNAQTWVSRTRIYFNPRSREGSDASKTSTKSPSMYFNPRSREGSDPLLSVHSISA